jgi:hypothetical protein
VVSQNQAPGISISAHPNLSLWRAGDKQAMAPKERAEALAPAGRPSYKHGKLKPCLDLESFHAAKPPCTG